MINHFAILLCHNTTLQRCETKCYSIHKKEAAHLVTDLTALHTKDVFALFYST